MAAKKRIPERLELVYKLDGDLREVDVFQLAPALLSMGQIIQEAHRQLGIEHEVGINVRPFGRGSFEVDIALYVKAHWPGLFVTATAMHEALANTTRVLHAIGVIRSKAESVISVIKKLKGAISKVEEVKPGEFRYEGDPAIR